MTAALIDHGDLVEVFAGGGMVAFGPVLPVGPRGLGSMFTALVGLQIKSVCLKNWLVFDFVIAGALR